MKYGLAKLHHVILPELGLSPNGRKEGGGFFLADLHQVKVLPVECSSLSYYITKD